MIAAELGQHRAGDALAQIIGHQFERAGQTRERAAALDVGDQQDSGVGKAGGLNVRQVAVVEVDLGD